MVRISLNDEPRDIAPGTPLSDAIGLWQFGGQKIAVAINGEFVPRSAYGETVLYDGDQIDIVTPVGGG